MGASVVASVVESVVDSVVDSTVDSVVDSAVGSAVVSAVGSTVVSVVGSTVVSVTCSVCSVVWGCSSSEKTCKGSAETTMTQARNREIPRFHRSLFFILSANAPRPSEAACFRSSILHTVNPLLVCQPFADVPRVSILGLRRQILCSIRSQGRVPSL